MSCAINYPIIWGDEVNNMNKIEKGLQFLMWASVVVLILIAVLVIMVGHATNYNFLYGVVDFTNISVDMLSNGKLIL